ncbi:MAG: phospholipid/cholesterol/gamma-HCH transport system substrate-binding protein [Solirubrobacteraceae bacterium]|nr:phospholipid/cholesterol/gamma-HCH transport system substrate-binding protein [Solirubrobacteraceae bacterium]
MRRGQGSIVANPVLVGAVTTLVTVVAVFLAYNANNGLPFVPTRSIKVDVSSGSNLVRGNEVREGGYRIGVVEKIEAVTLPGGQTVSRLSLKLDKKVGDIPSDTRVKVRPRSALGLKYIEFARGSSRRKMRDGDLIPISQTNVPVQFDDVFKIFDTKTRQASQENLTTFGNAFTGRGVDLNRTIQALPETFRYLAPVAKNLADPRTDIGRFFRELGDAARIVAPVADVQSRLFTHLATTFEAFSRDPAALEATIAKSPATLDESIHSFHVQTPFLRDVASFSRDLRGATHELRGALPVINPALEIGTPTLRRSVELNQRTGEVLGALNELVRAPETNMALRGFTRTVGILNPLIRFLGPYQTVCNGWNYFWTYLGEHISEGDPTGTAQRALLNSAGSNRNGYGSMAATEPVMGEAYQGPPQRGANAFFHGQAHGAAVNNNGTADCENGQRGYMAGNLATFGPAQNSQGTPITAIFDPHTPGSQGPTFAGRTRVPPGQTYSRENEIGTKLPPEQTTGIYSGDNLTGGR